MIAGESVVNTSSDQIVLALIAVISLSMGALVFVIRNSKMVKETHEQISQVNTAVNNIGPGEHRLYDKVTHVISELEDVKNILHDVTIEISQHRLYWEQLHKNWGPKKESESIVGDLASTLDDIRQEVLRVQEQIDKLPIKEIK